MPSTGLRSGDRAAEDVLVVGAGPAGTVAATVLARAGARVRILDRASFPRDKLCGDTLNPGTLAIVRRLGMARSILDVGLPIRGMLVTGERGVAVETRYPDGLTGRSLQRSKFDALLLQDALREGVEFEPNVAVTHPSIEDRKGSALVSGVVARTTGKTSRSFAAKVIIAADGRHSTLAFALGLARHPAGPRRWAIGGWFEGALTSDVGEMHIRRGRYVGVAPLPGGVANVCLVLPAKPGELADPAAALQAAITADPLLAPRFSDARLIAAPRVLGPLAVDVTPHGVRGLLLAGDAAGFVDPMTGDGLRFAIRGGELAAEAALHALTHGWSTVHPALSRQREREFAGKWRFNRTLRALVASDLAVRAAGMGARIAPGLIRTIVTRAGDCALARQRVGPDRMSFGAA
jgi:geranylgeranyl reductase family protein